MNRNVKVYVSKKYRIPDPEKTFYQIWVLLTIIRNLVKTWKRASSELIMKKYSHFAFLLKI